MSNGQVENLMVAGFGVACFVGTFALVNLAKRLGQREQNTGSMIAWMTAMITMLGVLVALAHAFFLVTGAAWR